MIYTIFKPLIDDKFLNFFNSLKEKDMGILDEFLNLMVDVTEQFEKENKNSCIPIEIIKDIKSQFGLTNSTNECVSIISKDYIDSLNTLEIFTLLWYSTCRNVMTYDKDTYVTMTNNGTIGRLLTQLSTMI